MLHSLSKVPVQVKGKHGTYQSFRLKKTGVDITTDEKKSSAKLIFTKILESFPLNEKGKEQFLKDIEPLVKKVVYSRVSNTKFADKYEDFVQESLLILYSEIENFRFKDAMKKGQEGALKDLSSFIYTRILRTIGQEKTKEMGLAQHQGVSYKKIKNIENKILQQTGKQPTKEDVIKQFNKESNIYKVTSEQVDKMDLLANKYHIDQFEGDFSKMNLFPEQENEYEKIDLITDIEDTIDLAIKKGQLREIDKEVFSLYYDIPFQFDLSQKKLSEIMVKKFKSANVKEVLAAGYREIAEAISSTKSKDQQKIAYTQINNSLNKTAKVLRKNIKEVEKASKIKLSPKRYENMIKFLDAFEYIINNEDKIIKTIENRNNLKMKVVKAMKMLDKEFVQRRHRMLDKLTNPYGNIPKSLSPIRITQRKEEKFDKTTLTKAIFDDIGVVAVIGTLKSAPIRAIKTLIFNRDKDIAKTWTLDEAKNWVKENKGKIRKTVELGEIRI